MPKREKLDVNQIAAKIIQQTTQSYSQEKNPAAVMLGRLGGLKGGRARAKSLSASKRKAIAKKAAQARWKNTKRS